MEGGRLRVELPLPVIDEALLEKDLASPSRSRKTSQAQDAALEAVDAEFDRSLAAEQFLAGESATRYKALLNELASRNTRLADQLAKQSTLLTARKGLNASPSPPKSCVEGDAPSLREQLQWQSFENRKLQGRAQTLTEDLQLLKQRLHFAEGLDKLCAQNAGRQNEEQLPALCHSFDARVHLVEKGLERQVKAHSETLAYAQTALSRQQAATTALKLQCQQVQQQRESRLSERKALGAELSALKVVRPAATTAARLLCKTQALAQTLEFASEKFASQAQEGAQLAEDDAVDNEAWGQALESKARFLLGVHAEVSSEIAAKAKTAKVLQEVVAAKRAQLRRLELAENDAPPLCVQETTAALPCSSRVPKSTPLKNLRGFKKQLRFLLQTRNFLESTQQRVEEFRRRAEAFGSSIGLSLDFGSWLLPTAVPASVPTAEGIVGLDPFAGMAWLLQSDDLYRISVFAGATTAKDFVRALDSLRAEVLTRAETAQQAARHPFCNVGVHKPAPAPKGGRSRRDSVFSSPTRTMKLRRSGAPLLDKKVTAQSLLTPVQAFSLPKLAVQPRTSIMSSLLQRRSRQPVPSAAASSTLPRRPPELAALARQQGLRFKDLGRADRQIGRRLGEVNVCRLLYLNPLMSSTFAHALPRTRERAA